MILNTELAVVISVPLCSSGNHSTPKNIIHSYLIFIIVYLGSGHNDRDSGKASFSLMPCPRDHLQITGHIAGLEMTKPEKLQKAL